MKRKLARNIKKLSPKTHLKNYQYQGWNIEPEYKIITYNIQTYTPWTPPHFTICFPPIQLHPGLFNNSQHLCFFGEFLFGVRCQAVPCQAILWLQSLTTRNWLAPLGSTKDRGSLTSGLHPTCPRGQGQAMPENHAILIFTWMLCMLCIAMYVNIYVNMI